MERMGRVYCPARRCPPREFALAAVLPRPAMIHASLPLLAVSLTAPLSIGAPSEPAAPSRSIAGPAQDESNSTLDMVDVEVDGHIAQRGRLRVPIVRANPDSKVIEIDVCAAA